METGGGDGDETGSVKQEGQRSYFRDKDESIDD